MAHNFVNPPSERHTHTVEITCDKLNISQYKGRLNSPFRYLRIVCRMCNNMILYFRLLVPFSLPFFCSHRHRPPNPTLPLPFPYSTSLFMLTHNHICSFSRHCQWPLGRSVRRIDSAFCFWPKRRWKKKKNNSTAPCKQNIFVHNAHVSPTTIEIDFLMPVQNWIGKLLV